MAKLGEICTFQSGGTPSKSNSAFFGGSIPWITTVALNGGMIDGENAVAWITDEAIQKSAAKIVPANSIMVGTRVGIGKVAINTVPMSTSQDVVSLTHIDTVRWDKGFLCKFILAKNDFLMAQARGATIKGIKIETLAGLDIPELTLEEQRHIAAVLDKVTGLIAQRRAQLDKLDLLVKSRFVEMFGDPIDNSHSWDTIKLKDIGTCKNGMNFHTDDFGVKIHCLGVADFKDYSFIGGTSQLSVISLNERPTEEYLLKNNDIVFVRSNGNKALVGRSVLVYPGTTPTTFSGFCIRFRLQSESIRPVYLLRVLKTDSVRKKLVGRGANIQNLNQKLLLELSIPVPPLELQDSFENFEKRIVQLRAPVRQSLNRLEILKTSLMQQYFG